MLPDTFGEAHDVPFLTTDVAGLQFYEYDLLDELTGKPIRPQFGERIELVREPRNAYDRNAVGVWYKNGQHQLGHLPRDVAADLAPVMDSGKHLRAYAVLPGNGGPWSAEIMVCGDGIPDWLHQKYLRQAWKKLDADLAEQSSKLGRDRAEAWEEADETFRKTRLSGSVDVLIDVLAADEAAERKSAPPLPEFTAQNRVGACFGWWDQIPEDVTGNPQFRTKTQWLEAGYKLKKNEKPSASIEYGRRRNYRRYSLYGSHQVEPKKVPTAAQIAKGYRLAIESEPALMAWRERRRAIAEEISREYSRKRSSNSEWWWDQC